MVGGKELNGINMLVMLCLFFSHCFLLRVHLWNRDRKEMPVEQPHGHHLCFRHRCHSSFVQPHRLDPLGALDQLAVNDMKWNRNSARISAELSLKSLERGRWQGEEKKKSTWLCVFGGFDFPCQWSLLFSATANQEIFALTVQESHMTLEAWTHT